MGENLPHPPAPVPEGKPRRRRVRRLALALLALALALGSLLAWWLDDQFAGSLPQLDGEVALAGLGAEVRVERDALGVPTIRAAGRADVAFATGFVHAQDRLFQMDLMRRHAAGELAELFGPVALDLDRKARVHGFRAMAEARVSRLPDADRAVLSAYARGVEAGRRSLRRPPFEYRVLGAAPAPWREEDSVLVALAMFEMLQLSGVERESATGLLYDLLPGPLADFLSPGGSSWDAPLVGGALPSPPIPGPEVLDLRKRPPAWEVPPATHRRAALDPEPVVRGSNNWAVAGKLTAHGGAIVANDMHLGLGVPNVWYRALLVWPGAGGAENRLVGVTLPGAPALVVGSNGHVAWGFTNTEGDWTDLVVLEPDPKAPDHYLTPEGPRALGRRTEVIRVKGAADETVAVETTVWGPVVDRDHRGRRRALRWVAHEEGGVNFELLRLESARTLEDVLAVAPNAGLPAQNLVIADAQGRIAWTVAGRIPRRVGHDGRRPASWADGTRRWDGWLAAADYPRVVEPPDGRLWTANNRVVGEPWLSRIGQGHYDRGARARQIRDGLRVGRPLGEADMLAIQLDDRALFLARWQKLLLETLSPSAVAGHPEREALRRVAADWGGRAAVDSVGFRVVRDFRRRVQATVLGALTAPCRKADPRFTTARLDPNGSESVWALLQRRPAHLLPPRFPDWDALLLDAADEVRKGVQGKASDFASALEAYRWGAHNTARIRHPLSGPLGPLGRWLRLDMPAEPLPGDSGDMPRVQAPSDGASQRLAVSPGREEQGYFHMPGGQSGHPLSPYYRAGHAAWVEGEPTPLLPGPAVHVLRLVPAGP